MWKLDAVQRAADSDGLTSWLRSQLFFHVFYGQPRLNGCI